MLTFTRAQLAQYDGKNGIPAYIAYRGRVYNVSQSWQWRGGRHWAMHQAGADLTSSLDQAPHGADMLARVPVAGVLVDNA